MLIETIEEVAKFLVIVASLYFAISYYVRHRRPEWSGQAEKRRWIILTILILTVATISVAEDVIGGESHRIDEAIMRFLHANTPAGFNGFFEAVTFTGSAHALIPLTAILAITLVCMKRRFSAVLISLSVSCGAAVIYLVKMAVNRDRPALWETQWYWGSSFPSGHTLAVAALAIATAICISRDLPKARLSALALAFAWIALVALSRMVLGVHWPTDVLAAACIGTFLPLAISIALELSHVWSRERHPR